MLTIRKSQAYDNLQELADVCVTMPNNLVERINKIWAVRKLGVIDGRTTDGTSITLFHNCLLINKNDEQEIFYFTDIHFKDIVIKKLSGLDFVRQD